MKTIIAMLAASLMSAAAWAQDSRSTTTDTTTTPTPSSDTNSLGEPSTDIYDDSTLSGSSTSDDSTFQDTDTTTAPSYEEDSSLSGSATEGTTNMAPAPAAPAPVAPTAPAATDTTSKAYQETDMSSPERRGGVYIEPGIFGSIQDSDISVGDDESATSNGFGVDLKLGGHINSMFFLAADGRYERSRFEGSSYEDTDADAWNWGPTAGVQAPFFGGRLWGTYVVDGEHDPDSGVDGTDLRFTDPYGWRFGAGVKFSSVSLNLEYEDLTYRTTEVDDSGGGALGTESIDFESRGYAVSLSFPMSL
ncbi:MAG: hypothetical protein ACAH59_07725 [Pseudobdellovibrionaceae bacterium]